MGTDSQEGALSCRGLDKHGVPTDLLVKVCAGLAQKGTRLYVRRPSETRRVRVMDSDPFYDWVLQGDVQQLVVEAEGRESSSVRDAVCALLDNGDTGAVRRAGFVETGVKPEWTRDPALLCMCLGKAPGGPIRERAFWAIPTNGNGPPSCIWKNLAEIAAGSLSSGKMLLFCVDGLTAKRLRAWVAKELAPSDAVAEIELEVLNQYGMHARPCALIVKTTSKFECDVAIEKDGNIVSGKSIMGLMSLQGSRGTRLLVSAAGPEAEELLDALEALFLRKFDED